MDREQRLARPITEELGPDDEPPAPRPGDDASPRHIFNPLETAEIDVLRDRRATLISPISAMLAESMGTTAEADGVPVARRDPAAPEPEGREQTRKLGESDRQSVRLGSAPVGGPSAQASRQRAAARIDEARAALAAGDLAEAVAAAEAALRESDEAPPPGIVEVIEPARPLLARVFAAYVGPSSGVPVLALHAREIASTRLGDAERAVLARVDGRRALEELFDGSGLGSTEALRMAARLIQSGAIRII